jgi:putative zinc finger/helix-turn-helix YgiT family protein
MLGTSEPQTGHRHSCELCDGEAVLSYETQEFNYGPESDGIVLSAQVPVWNCQACDEQILGEGAEEIMHEAVCAYLGRLTPREVKALRTSFGMLQDDFAELTGYGTASIKRWEAGSQIQSDSVDKHLRLIRSVGAHEARKRTRKPKLPDLKMPFDQAKWDYASKFELRKQPAAMAAGAGF